MEAFEVSEWKGFVAWLSLMAVFAGQLAPALSVPWRPLSTTYVHFERITSSKSRMVSYLYTVELLLLREQLFVFMIHLKCRQRCLNKDPYIIVFTYLQHRTRIGGHHHPMCI